jgi:hypothetical protein
MVEDHRNAEVCDVISVLLIRLNKGAPDVGRSISCDECELNFIQI